MNGPSYDVDRMLRGDRDYLWHHLKPHRLFDNREQMIIVAGEGVTVQDIRGRQYLDASSGGVWSVVAGYGRERIAQAVYEQLKTMPYFAGVVGNIPAIDFSEKLLDRMPGMGKLYYSNSGSEANEKAFKIVRQATAVSASRKGRYKILYRDRDYHGTTIAALSATGQEERKQDFGPLVPGFAPFPHALCYRCAFNKTYPDCDIDCARSLETTILREGPDTVGAVILEPITAGGGIIVPVAEYYPIIQEICRRHGVYLIMDEVVCGFGRTGRFWGYTHFDLDPDMVTMAKGMASSYVPLSATAVKEDIYEMFLNDLDQPDQRMHYFRDISTYGGCAGAFAAALENLRIIEDEKLVDNSRSMGAYLKDRLMELHDYPIVGDVRGIGLFCGIEFVQDPSSKRPVAEATMARLVADTADAGVLVGRTNCSLPGLNNIMNFAPPLIITRGEIDRVVAAVKSAIEKNLT